MVSGLERLRKSFRLEETLSTEELMRLVEQNIGLERYW